MGIILFGYLNFYLEGRRNGSGIKAVLVKEAAVTQTVGVGVMFGHFCGLDNVLVFVFRHDYEMVFLSIHQRVSLSDVGVL